MLRIFFYVSLTLCKCNGHDLANSWHVDVCFSHSTLVTEKSVQVMKFAWVYYVTWYAFMLSTLSIFHTSQL